MSEPTLRERVAEAIWNASRADEGTISATGANVVADAALSVVREALPDHEYPFHEGEADWMAGWNNCRDEMLRRLS